MSALIEDTYRPVLEALVAARGAGDPQPDVRTRAAVPSLSQAEYGSLAERMVAAGLVRATILRAWQATGPIDARFLDITPRGMEAIGK